MSRIVSFAVVTVVLSAGQAFASQADGCFVSGSCGGDTACVDDGLTGTWDACVQGQCVHCPLPAAQPQVSAPAACVSDPSDCNDGNPCTDDVCSPIEGCTHQPVDDGVSCEDAFYCTMGDSCFAGECQPGPKPRSCASEGTCTVVACDETQDQCATVAISEGASCDDGDASTSGDLCDDTGACAGTVVPPHTVTPPSAPMPTSGGVVGSTSQSVSVAPPSRSEVSAPGSTTASDPAVYQPAVETEQSAGCDVASRRHGSPLAALGLLAAAAMIARIFRRRSA